MSCGSGVRAYAQHDSGLTQSRAAHLRAVFLERFRLPSVAYVGVELEDALHEELVRLLVPRLVARDTRADLGAVRVARLGKELAHVTV